MFAAASLSAAAQDLPRPGVYLSQEYLDRVARTGSAEDPVAVFVTPREASMSTWHEGWEVMLLRHPAPPSLPCRAFPASDSVEIMMEYFVDVVSLDTVTVCGRPGTYRLVGADEIDVVRVILDIIGLPGHWLDNNGRRHTIHRDGRWEFQGVELRFQLKIESVTVEGSHNVVTFANLAEAAVVFGGPDSVNDMIKPIDHGFGFVRDMANDTVTFYRLRPALGLVFGQIDGPAPLLHLRRAP